MTKTQTVQIFWTIFLANDITHYHYTVCKVYKQYIVRLAISRSIFERYFERKIFCKEQKVFKILILCLNAFDKRNFKTRRLKKSWHAYFLDEQQELGLKVHEFKEQYLVEVEALKGKTHWDAKRKRHVPDQQKHGYFTKAVRSFYSNLSNAKSDSQEIKRLANLLKDVMKN